MAIICKTFSEAVESAMSVIEVKELFTINNGIIEDVNGEALKDLSITLLTATNAIVNKSDVDNLKKTIETWLKEDGIANINEQMITSIIKHVVDNYNQYKYLKKELRASVDETKNLPRLTSALFDKFIGDNTLKLFSKWFESTLVDACIRRTEYNIVRTNRDLNISIQTLKQRLCKNIVEFLNKKGIKVISKPIYEDKGLAGNVFNSLNYNLIIDAARNYFSSDLEKGKYKATGDSDKDLAYYSFFALLNFDSLIDNSNFANIISITTQGKAFRGSNVIPPFSIDKYGFAFKQNHSQRWDEDLSKDSDEVNPFVRKVLETTQMYEREGTDTYIKLPNQYLSYRNFKEVLRVLYETQLDWNYSSIRNNPRYISEIFERANKRRNTVFSGKYASLRPVFDTMYYALFSTKIPTSLASTSSKASTYVLPDLDVYGMLLNQINKTSFTTYTQYIMDPMEKTTEVSVLDSAGINNKKFEIEREIMIRAIYKEDRERLLKKWNVKFYDEEGNVFTPSLGYNTIIGSISLSDGKSTLKVDIKNNETDYTYNTNPVNKLEEGDFKETLMSMMKEILYIPVDDAYTNIISQLLKSKDSVHSVLDVITTAILNLNAQDSLAEAPNVRTIKQIYPGLMMEQFDTTPWKYYNSESRTMKISGFFKSMKGLETLAIAKSIINGDLSKSNVTDAKNNKLQKERLSCLTNDDSNLFNRIVRDNPNGVGKYNIFTTFSNLQNADSTSKIYSTELKTYFNSFYNTDPVKINKATDLETAYIYFVYDFLTRRGEVSVQPTVYSDKSTIWNKVFKTNLKLDSDKVEWIPSSLNGKTLEELSADEVRVLKKASVSKMASVYLDNILNDYKLLIEYGFNLKEEESSKFNSDDKLANYREYLTFLRKNANDKIIKETLLKIKHLTGKMPTILDQIHWVKSDGKFLPNLALYDFFDRYLSENNKYDEREEFNKAMYALKLQTGMKIELSFKTGKKIKEISDGITYHLDKMGINKKEYEDEWIDKYTDELILYKATLNGKPVESFTDADIKSGNLKVTLNPILDKYLAMDNFVSTSYNSLVYGLPYIHPAKGDAAKSEGMKLESEGIEVENDEDYFKYDKWDIITEEAARTNASYKRAVIGGATIHTWLKNKFDGIPNKLRLAVIEDPSDYVGNIHGGVDKATIYDGAIWSNPFHAIWEKNSLEELNQSDIHRKPIGYFSLHNYLSSGLMKCATFSVNNAFIRNSIGKNSAENMLRMMCDEKWKVPVRLELPHLKIKRRLSGDTVYVKDASALTVNPKYREVTVDENNNQKIVINEIIGLKYKNSAIDQNGDIANNYEITIRTSSLDGVTLKETTDEVNINSNYTLWKVLGGAKSVSYNGRDYDESSIETVASLASKLILDPKKSAEELEALIPEGSIYAGKHQNYARSLKSFNYQYFQPLKLSDVSFLANHSAIKNGAANIMSASDYQSRTSELLYIEIDPDFIGAQMSAEHDAENAEVSEMTQVMSALIQRGISYETTLAIYKDIGTYIAKGLKPYMNINNNKLILTLGKQLIASFVTDDLSSENLAARYIKLIKEDLEKENVDKELIVPFDDVMIFNKFVIDFANNFNTNIIRRKFSGLNAVLNPSHDVIGLIEHTDADGNVRLYTREDYEMQNGFKAIEFIPNTVVDPGEIVYGDWVEDDKILKQVSYKDLKDGNNYITLHELRSKYRKSNRKVIKVNRKGRNLRAQNFRFKIGSQTFDGYDLDSSRLSYTIEDLVNNKLEIVNNEIQLKSKYVGDLEYKRLQRLIEFVKSGKSLYSGSVDNLMNLIKNSIKESDDMSKEDALSKLRLIIKEWVLYDCKQIEYEKKFPIPAEYETTESTWSISEVDYQANEMLLPKVWAEKFRIRTGDNLGTILANPENFFKTKLQAEYDTEFIDERPEKAIAGLKGINPNNNMYVFLKEDFKENSEWELFNTDTYNLNGVSYIFNNKQMLFPLKGKNIMLYKNKDGELAVVIKDLSYLKYISNRNVFSELFVFDASSKEKSEAFSKNKLVSRKVRSEINKNGEITKEQLKEIYSVSDEKIEEQAKKMALTFKNTALNFIVARIPAQSMQSFMNMTVRGFINTDSNVVYVCDTQLWLQGSKLTKFKKSYLID